MHTKSGGPVQGQTPYCAPMFYSDAAGAYLLGSGPRFLNIYVWQTEFYGARHIPGPAHNNRALADKIKTHGTYGPPAYRIVIKPKAVAA